MGSINLLMKRHFTALSLLFLSVTGLAADHDPAKLPFEIAVHVPAGWKVIRCATGDLNGDGVNDLAMVREDLDPSNIIRDEEGVPLVRNTNPRVLTIMFGSKDGFSLHREFARVIPPEFDPEVEQGADRFAGMSVDRGVLTLSFLYMVYAGSSWVLEDDYKFRYEKGLFRLIGRESKHYSRAYLDITETSTNYLTRQVEKKRAYTLERDGDEIQKMEEYPLPPVRRGPFYLNAMPACCRMDED